MGDHIDSEGRFQSDKYRELAPDKIVLSFKDTWARKALLQLAVSYQGGDPDLSRDILVRLATIDLEGKR